MRLFTIILFFIIPLSLFSQDVLYQDQFTDGTSTIDWFSAWYDSVGNPITPMVASNETGPTDDWIGTVTGDTALLGSLGSALGGTADLTNYSVEADVYIELNQTFYNGLMIRADTTEKVQGYQFVANFYSAFGSKKVRFRYFSQFQEEIRVIAEIEAADLPGGEPTEDGWHKMKVKAVGNKFWLYWDDQEITGSPFIDPDAALESGFFGTYVWDAFAATPPICKVDNYVVREEGVYKETFTDGALNLDWFSAWYDSVGNPLTDMVATNQTGPTDDWIGTVTGDTALLGSLGSALSGSKNMKNYSVEADVYIELDNTFYNGLMIRADTTEKVTGYQFVANFFSGFGSKKVRLRYFSQQQAEIRVLAEIEAADLPGGEPMQDGWHKMKVKAIDDQFWLYWDDMEIAGSPFTDSEAAIDSGYFGVYVWDAFAAEPPVVKVDNIVAREESGPTSIKFPNQYPTQKVNDFALLRNYPNPFNPVTTIEFELKQTQQIKLTIYDLNGKIVKTLAEDLYAAGLHNIRWDATDKAGNKVAAGFYFYALRTTAGTISKKMILLK